MRQRNIGAANLLANALLKTGDSDRLSYTQLDHFARCLESLSIGALESLAVIYRLGTELRMSTGERAKKTQFDSISNQLPDYTAHLLMGTLRELDAHNLIHMPGAPDITTENYGNYPVWLTDLGYEFVDKILQEVAAN